MMKTLKLMIPGLVLMVLTALFTAGCNTVEGMGKDIERGGEEIQEAAD